MHLRRALLLFAIVLGLAAVATSVSRPPQPRDGAGPTVASIPDSSPGAPVEVRFRPGPKRGRERVPAGRAATVTVEVSEPGEVELVGLGLTAPAEPLTPARMEVFAARAARHEVRFDPAGESEDRSLGTLEVVAPGG